jgi:hypothetical protein
MIVLAVPAAVMHVMPHIVPPPSVGAVIAKRCNLTRIQACGKGLARKAKSQQGRG